MNVTAQKIEKGDLVIHRYMWKPISEVEVSEPVICQNIHMDGFDENGYLGPALVLFITQLVHRESRRFAYLLFSDGLVRTVPLGNHVHYEVIQVSRS